MKIDKELIERVAKVSRLRLSEEEKKQFINDFKDVLNTFSVISKINTEKIDLSVQPVKVENVFRDDKIKENLSNKDIFLNADHKEKEFFKGPRIL